MERRLYYVDECGNVEIVKAKVPDFVNRFYYKLHGAFSHFKWEHIHCTELKKQCIGKTKVEAIKLRIAAMKEAHEAHCVELEQHVKQTLLNDITPLVTKLNLKLGELSDEQPNRVEPSFRR